MATVLSRPGPSATVERRGEGPNRICVVISEHTSDVFALQTALNAVVSNVRVSAPNEIGEELWNTTGPRLLVGKGPEGVAALLPWTVLLQSLPNTATLALLDAGPTEL